MIARPGHAKLYRDPVKYRVSYLPAQLAAARRKVAMLENEARLYGMTELLVPHG